MTAEAIGVYGQLTHAIKNFRQFLSTEDQQQVTKTLEVNHEIGRGASKPLEAILAGKREEDV